VGNIMLDAEFSTGNNGDGDTRVYASVPDFAAYNKADVSGQHHSISHSDDSDAIIAINRYQAKLSPALDKMKAIAEPWARSWTTRLVIYGSGICDSNEQPHADLPILVAGHGAAQDRTAIWYIGRGRSLRPICTPHLMQKLG